MPDAVPNGDERGIEFFRFQCVQKFVNLMAEEVVEEVGMCKQLYGDDAGQGQPQGIVAQLGEDRRSYGSQGVHQKRK
jgi:hypothetical protein